MQYKKILSSLFLSMLLILSFSNITQANTALETKVDVLLSKFNDEDKKINFINNVTSKIDKLLSNKSLGEKNKKILIDLKNYLKTKIKTQATINSQEEKDRDKEYDLGVYAQQDGDYENAIKYYEEALAKNPNNHMAWNNLGMVYYTLGYYETAIENYNKAIEIFPDFAIALNNKGVSYYMLGDYSNAKVYINKAILISPSGRYYYNLGLVYNAEENFDKTLEYYKKAYSTKQKIVFTYDLATLYYNNEDYENAIKYYAELTGYKNEYQINSLLNTGNSYYYLGDNKKALEFFDKILKIDPKNEDALYNKSMLK